MYYSFPDRPRTVCTVKTVHAVLTVWKHNLRFIAHITLLLSNQSIQLQITDTTGRQTSVLSAARSTDCVDIASGSLLPVVDAVRACSFR